MGRKWIPVGGLLLLSLLWAAEWVRTDLSPGPRAGLRLSPLWSEAVLLGVFAAGSGVVGLARRRPWKSWDATGRTVLVGVGLFVVPAVLTELAAGWIDYSTRVAMFSLTPLLAVVFEPHIGGAEQRGEIRGGFLAAMMAVAGTFLVFPVELPHSYGTAFALMGLVVAAAVVAAANCLGVRETRRDGASVLMFAAVAAGSAACVIAAIAAALPRYATTAGSPLDVWALLDLIGLGLLFWLMRHMSAVQMTTRFLIAPLLANLIIVILLRPHMEVQSWIGLVLIAQGAGWMVFGHADSNAAHGKTLGLE